MAIDWSAVGTGAAGVAVGVGSVVAWVQRRERENVAEPRQRPIPLNGTKCDGHIDVCKAIAVLPMMAENVKLMRDEFRDHRSKVEQDISDAFTVLRRHERIIGRIEGTLDAQDDDETRGHERNKA